MSAISTLKLGGTHECSLSHRRGGETSEWGQDIPGKPGHGQCKGPHVKGPCLGGRGLSVRWDFPQLLTEGNYSGGGVGTRTSLSGAG